MALGAPISAGSGGDNITHFAGTRIRVKGAGSLQLSLISQDDVVTNTLVPVTLAASNQYSPLRLANVVTQNAKLRGTTTEIDEVFTIFRIIIYAKTLYTMVPG